MMKNVLFYTDTPLFGGAENQMYLLATFLPKDKYKISLACVTNKNLDGWCKKFEELGCTVARLNVLHKHDPRHYFYAKKLFAKADLVHIHIWNPASNRYALAAIEKTPAIVTEHDPFYLNPFKVSIKRRLLKNVRAVITPSEGARSTFLSQFPTFEEKTVVVYNGIDTAEWSEKVNAASLQRDEIREKIYKASPEDKIILCVAELHERKGQKYLIEGFQKISALFPNAKLVFVGGGPMQEQYKEFARSRFAYDKQGFIKDARNQRSQDHRDKVLFLGRRENVEALMTAADVFVLPSIREAFGLVLLEASVAKLPIIATDVGGIPEVVQDGVTGLIVSPCDAKALSKALSDLLKNPEKGVKLAQAASQRVHDLFDAKRMANETAQVYDTVLAQNAIKL